MFISRFLVLFHSSVACLHASTMLTWLLSILGRFEIGKCESSSFVLTLHAVLTQNCEQLYVNKLYNLDEVNTFIERQTTEIQ